MNARTELLRQAAELISADGNVCPMPFIVLRGDHATVGMAAEIGLLVGVVRDAVEDPSVTAIAFGFDRYTKPDQGTSRSSVYTYAVGRVGQAPVYGFIPYDDESREADPPNEEPTSFWNERAAAEILHIVPDWHRFHGAEEASDA